MVKVTYFNLSVLGTAERFFLMMAGTIILSFLSLFILAAIWGFAFSISFILGMSFEMTRKSGVKERERRILPLNAGKKLEKVA